MSIDNIYEYRVSGLEICIKFEIMIVLRFFS